MTTDKRFNRDQAEVISAQHGRHLVLAPPGCGKTAVLAERIVQAHEHGVPFSQMTCLTFTNRASRGMHDRIGERLPQATDAGELFVGSIHRFCSHFLFSEGVVHEQTAIIDTDTSFSILADFCGEDELSVLGDTRRRQHYSQLINLQHLMSQCLRGYPADLLVHRDALPPHCLRELCTAFTLSYTQASAVDLYLHADYYLDRQALLSSETQQLLVMLQAARRYEHYKEQADLMDFEDLLLRTYEALTPDMTDAPAQHAPTPPVRRRFAWIQVDEVQDLNPLQLAIVDAIAAPDATIVYLGDPQQAIFSFMGAKTDTLELLRQRCGQQGLHNFYQNYRSPQYLLDVFNTYGERQLGIAHDLLPSTRNQTPQRPGDLVLMQSETSADELNLVARMARRLYEAYPDETTAVVVAFNSDADDVSAALGELPHFKISGADFFASPAVRLLLAHLAVVAMEHNAIAWANVISGMHVLSSAAAARQLLHDMTRLAISPADFIDYDGSTYVAEFASAWQQHDFVVFDTETTGLSVFSDDVVELAAVRVRQGQVVAQLDLFIETDRELPAMLGDVPNPLIDVYAHQPHLSHEQAMHAFTDFAEGAELLGHNATYDYQIMQHQMERYAPQLSMLQRWPRYYDTLKLARLLWPRQKSYKLKHLIEALGLEGENSHLASDDIMATYSLAQRCADEASARLGAQHDFMARHRQTAAKLRTLYGPIYTETRSMLYRQQEQPALTEALSQAYRQLLAGEYITEQPKMRHLLRYVATDMLTPDSGRSLAEQLARHMQDLATLKEADLCGAQSMDERIFISTVHKAKGLEFDNVIVFDAVEGKYPSPFACSADSTQEEARKFYVAISRARRRLIITHCHYSTNRWGRTFERQLTPFMQAIAHLFAFLLLMLLPYQGAAQPYECLRLPNQEQLPSSHVLCVMQDSEGALWYATQGGGISRDDGRDVDVFRNDARRPDLLGSNNVACLAEAGHHIVVGTFHGAYLLDKTDYSLRRIKEVDDNRVDDILLMRCGDVLLTANKKIYRFDRHFRLKHSWPAGGRYVAHLFEDSSGGVWATQWNGGLLHLRNGSFEAMPWPLDVPPTDMAEAGDNRLWIGTVGQGVVAYHTDSGMADRQPQAARGVCTDLQTSADHTHLWVSTTKGLLLYQTGQRLSTVGDDSLALTARGATGRLSLDLQGRLLVANGKNGPFAVASSRQQHRAWPRPTALTAQQADSVRSACSLTVRPSALAYSSEGHLWFSTGKDIRRQRHPGADEEVMLSQAKDVSAMAFASDGTLWLGTIFGTVYRYKDGQLTADDYADNEHGDAIVALAADSGPVLTMACDRYLRRYDVQRHTLQQQSTEPEGCYLIELQPTRPGEHWSRPDRQNVVERLPQWLTSWWMWCVYALALLLLTLLLTHYAILRRQRKRFIERIKAQQTHNTPPPEDRTTDTPAADEAAGEAPQSHFLQAAIAHVESHLGDDGYNVEQLSSDLCMSRMTLYRKIQAATGQKPTEFMRTIRLRHAAEMLQKGEKSIKEVSYATGFSSVSYFSRCFRTMYGVPPTMYGSLTTADGRSERSTPSSSADKYPTNTPESV